MTHDRDSLEDVPSAEDQVSELLKLAGRRPMPSPLLMSRARAAARTEWAHVARRRRWHPARWLAAAAAAVVVAGLGWTWTQRGHAPASRVRIEIGALHALTGPAVISNADGRRRITGPDMRLRIGDHLETLEHSRATFVLDSGTSVSIDRGSRVVLENRGSLALETGAVYVDTGSGAGKDDLVIRTPHGLVRHHGTQFEVRLLDLVLHVRVREGTVAVERAGERTVAEPGEALVVAPGAPPVRRRVATHGAEWDWVVGVAEPFVLEGSTVPAFLDWVSRQQGWRWRYADRATRERADGIVLHGSIQGLTPQEALEAVLPTCGLASRQSGDLLVVSARRR